MVLLLVLFLTACGSEPSEKTATDEVETNESSTDKATVDETDVEEENEIEEDNSAWDDVKNLDNIIGKSDKDFTELTKSKPSKVRNDKTGNWRKITLSENINIEEYALSYAEKHMNEGEVHYIINFTNNTTTWLNNLGGLLYVDVKERVDKEEHDAATLGSGMLLKSYVIYPDGDIEELNN